MGAAVLSIIELVCPTCNAAIPEKNQSKNLGFCMKCKKSVSIPGAQIATNNAPVESHSISFKNILVIGLLNLGIVKFVQLFTPGMSSGFFIVFFLGFIVIVRMLLDSISYIMGNRTDAIVVSIFFTMTFGITRVIEAWKFTQSSVGPLVLLIILHPLIFLKFNSLSSGGKGGGGKGGGKSTGGSCAAGQTCSSCGGGCGGGCGGCGGCG